MDKRTALFLIMEKKGLQVRSALSEVTAYLEAIKELAEESGSSPTDTEEIEEVIENLREATRNILRLRELIGSLALDAQLEGKP